MKGRLFLAPSPLDFGCAPPLPALTDVLPLGAIGQMAHIRHWICENAKTTRALLKRIDAVHSLCAPLQELHLTELPRVLHKKGDHALSPHDPVMAELRELLAPALVHGEDMALNSEAGMPAIADPGASIVSAAHSAGMVVIPLTGPSSLLLTLAASGLNGQNFAFVGYLPQDVAAKTRRLQELEQLALKTGQTQLWIETPYRNQSMLQTALQVLKPSTRLCVAHGLTLPQMHVMSAPVGELRRQSPCLPDRIPAVFALGR